MDFLLMYQHSGMLPGVNSPVHVSRQSESVSKHRCAGSLALRGLGIL